MTKTVCGEKYTRQRGPRELVKISSTRIKHCLQFILHMASTVIILKCLPRGDRKAVELSSGFHIWRHNTSGLFINKYIIYKISWSFLSIRVKCFEDIPYLIPWITCIILPNLKFRVFVIFSLVYFVVFSTHTLDYYSCIY